MGITLGTYGDNGPGGWTTVTPSNGTGPSGFTSNLIYVSDSTGTDAPTSGTVASPCKTIYYALTTATVGTLGVGLRNGHPDWVLLKKGDTFTNQCFTNKPAGWAGNLLNQGYAFDTSNLATAEPFVVTSYTPTGATTSNPRGTGTGARPLVTVDSATLNAQGWVPLFGTSRVSGGPYSYLDYFCLMGIEFYQPDHDPNNAAWNSTGTVVQGIKIGTGGNFALVEDCKVTYTSGGLDFGGIAKIIERRNVIAYNYAFSAGAAMGAFLYGPGINSIQIEESYSNNNGWYDGTIGGARTNTNHNYYIQYPLKLKTVSVSSSGVGTPIVLTWPDSEIPQNNVNYDIGFQNACGPITTQIQQYFAGPKVGNTTTVLDSLNGNATMLANGTEPATVDVDIHDEWTGIQCTVKGLVSLLASYAGVHQRPVGLLFDSFFAKNGTNVSYGYTQAPPGQTTNLIQNVVSIAAQGFNYLTTGGPAWGMIINPTSAPVTVDNAIVAHPDGTAGLLGITVGSANEASNNPLNHQVTVQNSICADWGFVTTPNQTSNITDYTTSLPHNTFTNNVSIATAPDVGSGSTATYSSQPSWPAPNRSITSFDIDVLGGPGTLAHFLTAIIGTPGTLTGQSRDNWDSRLTSNNINNYFRNGFGRGLGHGGRGLGRF